MGKKKQQIRNCPYDDTRVITIEMERRHVAYLDGSRKEKLGFFHGWSVQSVADDLALVETTEGHMILVSAGSLRFLPVGNDIYAPDLEKMYREIGLLEGGDTHE